MLMSIAHLFGIYTPVAVVAAMKSAWSKEGVKAEVRSLALDSQGTVVTKSSLDMILNG